MMPDLDKLSKDRRDWLEVFGNQWAPVKMMPGTCEACVWGRGCVEHGPGLSGKRQVPTPGGEERAPRQRAPEHGLFFPVKDLTLEQFRERYPESQNGPNFHVRCLISK